MKFKLVLLGLLSIFLLQSVLAVECGSSPTIGCTITQNTTFDSNTYNVYGILISGSDITLVLDGTTLDYNESWIAEGTPKTYITNSYNGYNNTVICINGATIRGYGYNYPNETWGLYQGEWDGNDDGWTVIGCNFENGPGSDYFTAIFAQTTDGQTFINNTFNTGSNLIMMADTDDIYLEGNHFYGTTYHYASPITAVNNIYELGAYYQGQNVFSNITGNTYKNDVFITYPVSPPLNAYFYDNTIYTNLGDADDGEYINYCVDGVGNYFVGDATYGYQSESYGWYDSPSLSNNEWYASCPYLSSAYLMKNEYVSGGYLLPALNTTSDSLSMIDITTGLTNDNAFGFNGASSNLISSTDNMPIAGDTDWSVCWRYKSNSTNLQRVMSQQGVFAPHLYASPGTFSLLMSDYDFSWDKSYSVSGWTSDVWREDCITKDATSGFSGFTFYSNGVETPLTIDSDGASGIDTMFPSGTGALWYIGGNDQDQWFSGEISEVCMFDKELSDREVARLSTQSQCGFAPANDITIEPPPCVPIQSGVTYSGNITVCAGIYNTDETITFTNGNVFFEEGVIIDGSGVPSWEPVVRLEDNTILNCNRGEVNGHADYETWDGTIGIQYNGNNIKVQYCTVNWHTHDIDGWYDTTNNELRDTFCTDDAGECFLHGIGSDSYIYNSGFSHALIMGLNVTVEEYWGSATFGHPGVVEGHFTGNILNSQLTNVEWGNVPTSGIWNFSGNKVYSDFVTVWDEEYPPDVYYYKNIFFGNVDDTADYVTQGIDWCVDGIGNYIAGTYNGNDPDMGTCPSGTPPYVLQFDAGGSPFRLYGSLYYTGDVSSVDWYVDETYISSGDSFATFDNILSDTNYTISAVLIYDSGNITQSEVVNTGVLPSCVPLDTNWYSDGIYVICAGTYTPSTSINFQNADVMFEEGVVIDGSNIPDWDVVVSVHSNTFLDCNNGKINGHVDYDQWQGTQGLNLDGGTSNVYIQNCDLNWHTHDFNAWNSQQNVHLKNIYCSEDTDCFMHGTGTNAVLENIVFGSAMFMGTNMKITNSSFWYVNLGHPNQECCAEATWSGSIKDTFIGSLQFSNVEYNSPFNFTNNLILFDIDNMNGGNNGQQSFIGNRVVGNIYDNTDYGAGDYVAFCDIPSKTGNRFANYYGGDENSGTCSCQYINDNWFCALSEDTTLSENTYEDVGIITAASDVTFDCGNSLFHAADNPYVDMVRFATINHDRVTLKNCRFDNYGKIAQINANDVIFDQITDNHRKACWNPSDCTDTGPGYFYQVGNVDTQGRNVVINNSMIMGDVQLEVQGKNLQSFSGDYCGGDLSTELILAYEEEAGDELTIASHIRGDLEDTWNISYQSIIPAPMGDGERCLQGINLNISSFDAQGATDAYLRVAISTSPDYSGEMTRGYLTTDVMQTGLNEILFEDFFCYNEGQTYYLIFQAAADADPDLLNLTINGYLTFASVYPDGEFVFVDDADPNTGIGTERAETRDLVVGLIYGSDTRYYIPDSPHCTAWDYTNGATEEECAPGMWDPIDNRCEDSRGTWTGGNCNQCNVDWGWFNGYWYSCNLDTTPVNFIMENTVIDRSNGTIAEGANSGDGRANRFFEHQLFPYAYAADGVSLINNTWIYPESTAFEDPVDGWQTQQHSLMARFGGIKNGIAKDNTFWNGKAGISVVGMQSWFMGGDVNCPNEYVTIANNTAYPLEATGANGFDFVGNQHLLVEGNLIDARGSLNRDMIALYSGLPGVKDYDIIVRNNRLKNTTANNVALLAGNLDLGTGLENVSIYNNDWSEAQSDPSNENQFIRFGLYYTNGSDGRHPVNLKFYNNTLRNIRLWQMPEEVDMCNGVGNTYLGIFRVNMFSYYWHDNEGGEGDVPNMEYYLPDCDVELGRYLEIKHNQGNTDESGIILGRNHTWTMGQNTEYYDTLNGITVEEELSGGSYSGKVKDIKVRGDLAESSIIIEGTTDLIVENLDVVDPYYDYGVNTEFRSLTVPAPVFSGITRPVGEIKETQTNIGYSVYTVAEIDNCILKLNNAPVNVQTSFTVNQKNSTFLVPLLNLARSSHAWELKCTDVFGNSYSTADLFSVEKRGSGGGPVVDTQKESDLPIIDFEITDGVPGQVQDIIEAVQTVQEKIRSSSSDRGFQSSLLVGVGAVAVLVMFGAFNGVGKR